MRNKKPNPSKDDGAEWSNDVFIHIDLLRSFVADYPEFADEVDIQKSGKTPMTSRALDAFRAYATKKTGEQFPVLKFRKRRKDARGQ